MIVAWTDADGLIVGMTFGPNASNEPAPEPGLVGVPVSRQVSPGAQYIKDGSVLDLPAKTDDWLVWDSATETWSDPQESEQVEGQRNSRRARINAERDRRIALGFLFRGKTIQLRPDDMQRVTGWGSQAGFAVDGGAQPGDFRWHGGNEDFQWITEDNTTLQLDAQGMFEMAKAARVHESDHVFAARRLKTADPIPEDFTNDAFWPPSVWILADGVWNDDGFWDDTQVWRD